MAPSPDEEAKVRAARELVFGQATKPRFQWQLPAFTAAVLGSYLFYFYCIEQPDSPPPPPAAAPLPPNVVREFPDGRLLMADGSIHRRP
ncbi:hypothetical protein AB1Y20_015826 [Prymnesium parvum]|uniref:Uncharacterized protein n=1 Tax=Prymnesium parvum TaxID=97485 RepID=A0AB34JXV5_PRYPA